MPAVSATTCRAGATRPACATLPPSPRPEVQALAMPLRVPVLDIALDHLGAYAVDVGVAGLPDGAFKGSSASLVDERPTSFWIRDADLVIEPVDPKRPPVGSVHREPFDGVESVRVRLVFDVTELEPGCGPPGSRHRRRVGASRAVATAGFGVSGPPRQTVPVPASGRRIQRQPRASTSADRPCRVRRWTVVRGCVPSRVGRSRTRCVPMSASRAPPPLSDGRKRRPTVRRNDWLVTIEVFDAELEDVESGWSRGALGAVGRRPFGRGRIVLDEERRAIMAQRLRRGQAPPDDAPVGTNPFAIDRLGEGRAPVAERRDVGGEIVAGDRPCREAAACLERSKRRRADPRARGRRAVEHADELQVAVTQPDQPVERPEPVVAAATAGCQPEPRLELRRCGVRVRDRDDEVVDPEEHRRSMRHGP